MRTNTNTNIPEIRVRTRAGVIEIEHYEDLTQNEIELIARLIVASSQNETEAKVKSFMIAAAIIREPSLRIKIYPDGTIEIDRPLDRAIASALKAKLVPIR